MGRHEADALPASTRQMQLGSEEIMFTIYIDGENHFHRTEDYLKQVRGEHASLEQAIDNGPALPYPYPAHAPRLRVDRRSMFFWDAGWVNFGRMPTELHEAPARAVYFTSCSGEENVVHEARLLIRANGFEPRVIWKPANARRSKGVDISLAVRMIEDAHYNAFSRCVLFTSDADFLPAIEAAKRMGKRVIVAGYADFLSDRSPLQFEPDQFVDLGQHVKNYALRPMAGQATG